MNLNLAGIRGLLRFRENVLLRSLIGLLCLIALPGILAAQVTIVESGNPKAVILLSAEPTEKERYAAQELVEHIQLISGAELPVLEGGQPARGQVAIRLGGATNESLHQKVAAVSDNNSSFLIETGRNTISVRGFTDEGTLFGVYELLEQLGVRWYHPGDIGRVIPHLKTVTWNNQENLQVPSFDYRRMQHITGTGPWSERLRLGGNPRSTGAHNIPPFRGGAKARLFEENPEWRALVNGERRGRQICVGNPEVLQMTIDSVRAMMEAAPDTKYLGMGPDDGGGYCECPLCTARDGGVHDPFRNALSNTDRYIWFFNRILEALEDDYPDLHIVTYIYASHMMPPAYEAPNPRIVAVFAPITVDRIRGMDNPMSPDRHTLRWLIDEWNKFGLNEYYYRGYYNNLACPQFPISQVDRIRHETPAFRELGINVMRVETIRPSWSGATPSLYLAPKMMWNVDTDVDALLEEFYSLFYGPAEPAMKDYLEALDDAFTNTPYFTGTSYPYFKIFDIETRDRFRGYLDRAAELVKQSPPNRPEYAERVHNTRRAWDRLEIFLQMTDARNELDFVTAHKWMEEYLAISEEIGEQVLESGGNRPRDAQRLLNWREANPEDRGNYFHRFFSQPVESGHLRTVENGKLVHGFQDQWDFLIDPTQIGEIAGYHRPGKLGGNWQPMGTYSETWSDKGLHYYKGESWYRTEFDVSAEYKGKPLYLWFAGVDQVATVWVNGVLLGTSRAPLEGVPGVPGTFRPFDMNATNAIQFDGPNTVVVKVTNISLNELGTGGIVGPVMLWTPNDPAWTPWAQQD